MRKWGGSWNGSSRLCGWLDGGEADSICGRNSGLVLNCNVKPCSCDCSVPTDFQFTLQATDSGTAGRMGLWQTPHGVIETPAFMPVGTKATVWVDCTG